MAFSPPPFFIYKKSPDMMPGLPCCDLQVLCELLDALADLTAREGRCGDSCDLTPHLLFKLFAQKYDDLSLKAPILLFFDYPPACRNLAPKTPNRTNRTEHSERQA